MKAPRDFRPSFKNTPVLRAIKRAFDWGVEVVGAGATGSLDEDAGAVADAGADELLLSPDATAAAALLPADDGCLPAATLGDGFSGPVGGLAGPGVGVGLELPGTAFVDKHRGRVLATENALRPTGVCRRRLMDNMVNKLLNTICECAQRSISNEVQLQEAPNMASSNSSQLVSGWLPIQQFKYMFTPITNQ